MSTMRSSRVLVLIGAATLATGACKRHEAERGGVETTSAEQQGKLAKLSEDEAAKIAQDAYVYGYPLVTMEMTRRVMTNVAAPTRKYAPMGQFANMRQYPTPSDHDVTTPNADTLYSAAWLDVSKEPYVFSIPDAGDRYYLMPLLDGFTEVFQDPGTRTTGTKPQTYAITGPSWKGQLPTGMTEYKSATNLVWIIGRTYCSGTPADYAAVHAFQDKLALVPLSAWGRPYTPPPGKVDASVDMKTAVRDQVDRMDAETYFKTLSALLQNNPPTKADAPMMSTMAKIGIAPGRDFDMSKLDPAMAKAVSEAPAAAQKAIHAQAERAGRRVNGWIVSTKTGNYGTDYMQRAAITMVGLGANKPEDAMYPMSRVDADGKPYDGANRYVMRFAKGQLPPVKGFWSLTMYDEQMFFVENPLHRYSVSPRNDLRRNADGSIDLYVQKDSPGKDKEPNWLPAPAGKFNLVLRAYWPDKALIDGKWEPPPVTMAK